MPDSLDVEVVDRLAGALGAPLSIGPQLSGSDRWIVVRATAGARALVIKHARTRRFDWAAGTPEPNVTRFASERAALEFFAADPELAPLVPNLVLAHEATGTIVMDDLGVHPTLADVLLGANRPLAEAQLRDLATLLGTVARRSSVRARRLSFGADVPRALRPPPGPRERRRRSTRRPRSRRNSSPCAPNSKRRAPGALSGRPTPALTTY